MRLQIPFSCHPKALVLLTFCQMWKSFSHYGMRALLVLYLITDRHFSDAEAIGLFAIYSALLEFLAPFGGLIGDRFLGHRRAIFLGGWLMALGHLTLASESALFLGLTFLIVGSLLFSPNIIALLGQFYESEDLKREEGFTLFYIGLNCGAFLATILCAVVATRFGWHFGFGLAAIGMIIGNLLLHLFTATLKEKGEAPKEKKGSVLLLLPLAFLFSYLATSHESLFLPLLPVLIGSLFLFALFLLRKTVPKVLVGALLLLILFFAADEQISSSLLLFFERRSSKLLFGYPLSFSALLSLNPLLILLMGGAVVKSYHPIKKRIGPFTLPLFITAFCFISAGIVSLYLTHVSALLPIAMVALITLSELMVGPQLYALTSKTASQSKNGALVMSLLPMSFALASTLGGLAAKTIAQADKNGNGDYGLGFFLFGLPFLFIALSLAIRRKKVYVESEISR